MYMLRCYLWTLSGCVIFIIICVLCRLVVLVRLSVPVQVIDWKAEHFDSGKIIRFDSIRQFDKTDACTLIVTHRLIITYDYFLIICIIDFL